MALMKFDIVDIAKIRKPKRVINRVFLHCSASDRPQDDNPRTIEKWHLDRKFKEIGYHFYIDKAGNIYEGRSLDTNPAAQQGHNAGTIAICCGGLKKENFTVEQKRAVRSLCLVLEHQIKGLTFHGHCEVSDKACPVYPYKEWLDLNERGVMRLL
ncbi:endodeoxyribonuclease I [Caudoviricetes sp.]|nr:endodeoxyribonuclease I [Caudoviricetes sp.]